MTSHAAVVARGWGKPCVAGCEAIKIDLAARKFRVNGKEIKEGDYISVNGATGEVFVGSLATIRPRFEEEHDLVTLLGWADEVRKLGVWTNADTPQDAARARAFGAEGIGLCRTEHMFFDQEGEEASRREIVVAMILNSREAAPLEMELIQCQAKLEADPNNEKSRQELEGARQKTNTSTAVQEYRKNLKELLPFQRKDFEGIFRAMDGYPVIIRLIDPPMHEFFPPREELIEKVTRLRCTGEDPEKLAELEEMLVVVNAMWEINPMLGLRGCRAGLMYPGLTEMQTRAIMEAACNVAQKGVDVHPEINGRNWRR